MNVYVCVCDGVCLQMQEKVTRIAELEEANRQLARKVTKKSTQVKAYKSQGEGMYTSPLSVHIYIYIYIWARQTCDPSISHTLLSLSLSFVLLLC